MRYLKIWSYKGGFTLESDNKVFIDIDKSEGGNHAS